MTTYLVRRARPSYANLNNPFAVSRAFDRMVREAFGSGAHSPAFTPAVDLTETAEAYQLEAALPGWKPEQVDVSIENGVLSLKGEVADAEPAADGVTEHVREIRRSSFLRRFTLPAEVEADKATASFADGILTLRIPKAEVVKPKQIRIEVKS
jgi:HSP20 family protein